MASSFLREYPRGAYTCARMHSSSSKILSAELHLERICDSFRVIFESDLETIHTVRNLVSQELKKLFDSNSLLVLHVFLPTPGSDDIQIKRAEFPLISSPGSSVDLVVLGISGPRDRCAVKDTLWLELRQPYEQVRDNVGAQEYIMCEESEDGILLMEGLVTNFFVLLDDGCTLETAPCTKVLSGTMRDIVIRACSKSGLQVKFQCPRWEARHHWKQVFIASVAKPLYLVRRIQFNQEFLHFPANPEDEAIKKLLEAVDYLL